METCFPTCSEHTPMEYFDVDDISFREETLCIKFPYKVEFLGLFLLNEREDVPASRRVDVPVFLLDFILQNGHCFIEKEVLSLETRNSLHAKPAAVSISGISRHFYEIAHMLYEQDYSFFYEVFLGRMAHLLQKLVEKNLGEQEIEKMDINEEKIISFTEKSITEYRVPFSSLSLSKL